MFTDESKFNIFRNSGRFLEWRRPNTEFEPQNIQSIVKYGGGGVIVWDCMAASGVRELEFIEKKNG